MQPFKAAMLKVRQAFYDAFTRSLLRTKSLLQTILDLWISPRNTTPKPPRPTKEPESESSSSSSPEDSEEERLGNGAALGPSERREKRTVEDFIDEVSNLFRSPTTLVNLTTLSSALHSQFVASLKDNAQCMLPSFQHQMPSGKERGTFLALDVGGSTFRVALIQLFGKDGETRVLRRTSTKIDDAVRGLMGVLFFDWMAERIEETLEGQREGHDINAKPLSMGMAWSFPIEQTSPRSGLLMNMGKHFMAAHGLQGQDLGDLIQDACGRRNLNVSLRAIVNDSSACLLSSAFTHPDHAHPFSLILGTGVNAAVNLPTSLFSPIKFGKRPDEWHASAKNVLVNSEFSMFGAPCLPFTRFDRRLLENHPRPDFQPIEHFVAGGYMGEIVRLVLVECIETTGIFGGLIPPSLTRLYSLDTETLSKIEADPSPSLSTALELFAAHHPPIAPYAYTLADIQLIRTIASLVVQRASAIVAAGLHALNTLQSPSTSSIPSQSSQKAQIAYNGSVIEHYPHFRENTQQYLDSLIGGQGLLELVPADDSSLIGAAVAVACLGVGEMDL